MAPRLASFSTCPPGMSSLESSASSDMSAGSPAASKMKDRFYYTNMIEAAKRAVEEDGGTKLTTSTMLMMEEEDNNDDVHIGSDKPQFAALHKKTQQNPRGDEEDTTADSSSSSDEDEDDHNNNDGQHRHHRSRHNGRDDAAEVGSLSSSDERDASDDVPTSPQRQPPQRRNSRPLTMPPRTVEMVAPRRVIVSFSEDAPAILEVESHREYTSKERSKCWYSDKDKARMLGKHERVVARLEQHRPCRPSQTYRGLESWTTAGAAYLDAVIAQSINAVMDEQDRQWRENADDLDRIASASLAVTATSAERARAVGMEDEEDAKTCLLQSWLDDDMSVSVGMTVMSTNRRAAGRQTVPNRRLRSLSPSRNKGKNKKDKKDKDKTSCPSPKKKKSSKDKKKKGSKKDKDGKRSSSSSNSSRSGAVAPKKKEQADESEQAMDQEEADLLAAVSAGARAAAAAASSEDVSHHLDGLGSSTDGPRISTYPSPSGSCSSLVDTLRRQQQQKQHQMEQRPTSSSSSWAGTQGDSGGTERTANRPKESDPPGRCATRNPSHHGGETLLAMKNRAETLIVMERTVVSTPAAVQPESRTSTSSISGSSSSINKKKVQRDADGSVSNGSRNEGSWNSTSRPSSPRDAARTGKQKLSKAVKVAKQQHHKEDQNNEDVQPSPSRKKRPSGMKVLKTFSRSSMGMFHPRLPGGGKVVSDLDR